MGGKPVHVAVVRDWPVAIRVVSKSPLIFTLVPELFSKTVLDKILADFDDYSLAKELPKTMLIQNAVEVTLSAEAKAMLSSDPSIRSKLK